MIDGGAPPFETEHDILHLPLPRRYLPATLRLAEPLDDDALYVLCRRHRDLRIERNAAGELIVMPPTGGRTGRRNFSLTGQLFAWATADGTGVGFDSSTGFRLPNGAERAPDVAWVPRERWDGLSDEEQEKFPPLCPDFVIELLSKSDDLADLRDKMQEYMDNGARLGWLIDPFERRAYVFRSDRPVETLDDPPRLLGDDVLPGFVLDLRSVW